MAYADEILILILFLMIMVMLIWILMLISILMLIIIQIIVIDQSGHNQNEWWLMPMICGKLNVNLNYNIKLKLNLATPQYHLLPLQNGQILSRRETPYVILILIPILIFVLILFNSTWFTHQCLKNTCLHAFWAFWVWIRS